MDKGDQYVWKYLLEHGGIIKGWEYFGGCFSFDGEKTHKCIKAIKKHGIDGEKSKGAKVDNEQAFVGTFADNSTVSM